MFAVNDGSLPSPARKKSARITTTPSPVNAVFRLSLPIHLNPELGSSSSACQRTHSPSAQPASSPAVTVSVQRNPPPDLRKPDSRSKDPPPESDAAPAAPLRSPLKPKPV